MTPCSRCAATTPNSSCFVCAEPDEETDTYPDDEDQGHDDYVERLLDRADYLRTERKDQEWEGAMEARGSEDEEERKLGMKN